MFTALMQNQAGTQTILEARSVMFVGAKDEFNGYKGPGVFIELTPGQDAVSVFYPCTQCGKPDDERAFVAVMNSNGKTVAKYNLS